MNSWLFWRESAMKRLPHGYFMVFSYKVNSWILKPMIPRLFASTCLGFLLRFAMQEFMEMMRGGRSMSLSMETTTPKSRHREVHQHQDFSCLGHKEIGGRSGIPLPEIMFKCLCIFMFQYLAKTLGPHRTWQWYSITSYPWWSPQNLFLSLSLSHSSMCLLTRPTDRQIV